MDVDDRDCAGWPTHRGYLDLTGLVFMVEYTSLYISNTCPRER